eukprot:SAG11_NODE_111_length_16190_cov_9.912808_8_plen_237_part_00
MRSKIAYLPRLRRPAKLHARLAGPTCSRTLPLLRANSLTDFGSSHRTVTKHHADHSHMSGSTHFHGRHTSAVDTLRAVLAFEHAKALPSEGEPPPTPRKSLRPPLRPHLASGVEHASSLLFGADLEKSPLSTENPTHTPQADVVNPVKFMPTLLVKSFCAVVGLLLLVPPNMCLGTKSGCGRRLGRWCRHLYLEELIKPWSVPVCLLPFQISRAHVKRLIIRSRFAGLPILHVLYQ